MSTPDSSTPEAPKYRAETKGQLCEFIAEFEAAARNQIKHADDFVFQLDDLPAYEEYRVYLTPAEMRAAFNRAMRAVS